LKDTVRIAVVVGPTAAGKTEIGIKLAQELEGEIISVDSMQIYRWMNIGTAKPTPELLSLVPHHLIDILNPDEIYNAGRFVADADGIIKKLSQEKKTIILVGGTNLYIRALINGIIEVPEISEEVRSSVRSLAAESGVCACYEKLKTLDPKSAEKLHPNDISRISRALEVILETGTSIQEMQSHHGFRQKRYIVKYICATWPREEIYDRINRRVHLMVDEGLIEETQKLLEMGYTEDLPSLNSIGYRQTVAYLKQQITKDEMIADIQQKSRRYAKKQLTWYKKHNQVHQLERNNLSKSDLAAVREFMNHRLFQ